MSTAHIFYHSADLDGHCGGAICASAYRQEEHSLHPIDYGDGFPHYAIEEGDTVVFVDWTPPPEDFAKVLDRIPAGRIIWLDHHAPNIKRAWDYLIEKGYEVAGPPAINCIQGNFADDGLSGCEKAWGWFFPDNPMPRIVHHLGRFDVWDHADLDTLPVQYGVKTHIDTDPSTNLTLWRTLLTDAHAEVEDVFTRGRAIWEYVQSSNRHTTLFSLCEVWWDGKLWAAVNAPLANSRVMDGFWKEEYVGVLIYAYSGDRGLWKVSLFRSPDRDDVSMGAIAHERGGGGHAGAAGFWC